MSWIYSNNLKTCLKLPHWIQHLISSLWVVQRYSKSQEQKSALTKFYKKSFYYCSQSWLRKDTGIWRGKQRRTKEEKVVYNYKHVLSGDSNNITWLMKFIIKLLSSKFSNLMILKKLKIKSVCNGRILKPCQESSNTFSGWDGHVTQAACWQLRFHYYVDTPPLFLT